MFNTLFCVGFYMKMISPIFISINTTDIADIRFRALYFNIAINIIVSLKLFKHFF